MKPSMQILIAFYLFVITSKFSSVTGSESVTLEPSEALTLTTTTQDNESVTDSDTTNERQDKSEELLKSEQRSIDFHGGFDGPAANEDRHAAFRKRAKPLKNIFLGLYKNYKSTYLGNQTLMDYRKAMHTRKDKVDAADYAPADGVVDERVESEAITKSITELSDKIATESETLKPIYVDEPEKHTGFENTHEKLRSSKKKRKKQRLRKSNHRRNKHGNVVEESTQQTGKTSSPVYRYDFGHGYNMSLDMSNDIVSLRLDGESLRDLMQGRFLKEGSEGRGKKYEMITRVLPLFIIPFLIQSAVVPFLVTKLKLLLMKSILVGKLAIFLLVLSAIKNGNKMMQTYEVAPSYWAGEPSRRSELAAAASAAAYNGYRVEGKPAAWIN